MFRNNLLKIRDDKEIIYIDLKWSKEIPGLVRVPFFDESDFDNGYVVYYSEVYQSYGVLKYSISNGEIIWKQKVVNGGYGTPIVSKDLVIVLYKFDSIIALNKYNGEKVWEFNGDARVRSSINIINDEIVFSSGDTIYFIDYQGNCINQISYYNAFFYGTISKYKEYYLAMYNISIENNSSHVYVSAFSRKGDILFECDLGESYVISSDTSGFILNDKYIYVSGNDVIYKISADTGEIIWREKVRGISGRHVPIVDNKSVYYTTLQGEIGSINKETGVQEWSFICEEGSIVSPPSIYGLTLLILADCSLYLINKESGEVYDKFVTGHSPYSAVCFKNNSIIIGGGEPPANGLLLAYDILPISKSKVLMEYFSIGNFIESEYLQITINLSKEIKEAYISPSVIANEDKVYAKIDNTFKKIFFKMKLKNNNISGAYCIPLTFTTVDENTFTRPIEVKLSRRETLPQSYRINSLYKEIKQTSYNNSGSAIASFIFKQLGKDISQDEFRKIIDYIKDKSELEDADFQTWRLVLKRALSSPATSLDEFIRLENNYNE